MKQLLCLILAMLMFFSMTACNVTSGSGTPNDNFQYPDLPEPPDEFAPPIDDDDYDTLPEVKKQTPEKKSTMGLSASELKDDNDRK